MSQVICRVFLTNEFAARVFVYLRIYEFSFLGNDVRPTSACPSDRNRKSHEARRVVFSYVKQKQKVSGPVVFSFQFSETESLIISPRISSDSSVLPHVY